MQSFAFVLLLLLLLNRVILCDFYIEQRKKRWPGGWVLYCNCTLGSVVVFLWKLENNSKKFGVSRYDDERVFEEFSFFFFFFVNEIFSNIYLKFPCLEAFFWNKNTFSFLIFFFL